MLFITTQLLASYNHTRKTQILSKSMNVYRKLHFTLFRHCTMGTSAQSVAYTLY